MVLLIYWDINLQRGSIKWDSISVSPALIQKHSLWPLEQVFVCVGGCESEVPCPAPLALLTTVEFCVCLLISLVRTVTLSVTTNKVGGVISSNRNLPFKKKLVLISYWGSTAIFFFRVTLLCFDVWKLSYLVLNLWFAGCNLMVLHKALAGRLRNPRESRLVFRLSSCFATVNRCFPDPAPNDRPTDGSPKESPQHQRLVCCLRNALHIHCPQT